MSDSLFVLNIGTQTVLVTGLVQGTSGTAVACLNICCVYSSTKFGFSGSYANNSRPGENKNSKESIQRWNHNFS